MGCDGAGVKPAMKRFSGSYLSSGGKFRQYRAITPQLAFLPIKVRQHFAVVTWASLTSNLQSE